MGSQMKQYESDIDSGPATSLGLRPSDTRRLPSYVPADDNGFIDYSPNVPARPSQTLIERILTQPAPLPQRDVELVERERLEGADERATPISRAVASFIRSSRYLVAVLVVGCLAYVAIPSLSGYLATLLTLLVMCGVMLYFDRMEYKHSQPGVELQRSQDDHELAMEHEGNRHVETMAAIEGDIEIKLRVLGIGEQYARLADRRRGEP